MGVKKFGNLYLDTDILRQFDFDIHKDPRLANLKAKLLVSNIYVPKIVFDEWVVFYKEVLKGVIFGLRLKVENVNKYVNSKINLELKDKSELGKELVDNLLTNIKMAGIEIFENPFDSINLRQITEMAIHKIKPFQEEGRGFKDTLILFAILEHCKHEVDLKHFFLTGNKADFDNDDVKNLIIREKVDLTLVFSIEELNEYFDEFVDKKAKEIIAKRRDNLKTLLLSQKNKIINFIKNNGEFSPLFLRESFPFTYDIEKIKEIDFLDILDPMAGFLEKNVNEGDVEIYFNVKLRFNLLIRKSTYETPKLKIGEGPSIVKVTLPPRFTSTLEEVVVDKYVIVKGKIHVKNGGIQGQYAQEIQLEEVSEPNSLQKALLGQLFQ